MPNHAISGGCSLRVATVSGPWRLTETRPSSVATTIDQWTVEMDVNAPSRSLAVRQ